MANDRYAVSQRVLRSGDLATDLAWAEAAGAAAVGLEAADVVATGTDATRQLLDRHALTAVTIHGGLPSILHATIDEAAIHQVRSVVERAAALGARGVIVTTGWLDRPLAEADRHCSAWLAAMAPVAAAAGALLLLEPVHPLLRRFAYVHTLRHAADLTGEADGTGLLADTAHLWWDRDLMSDISTHGGRIGSVQIADVDSAGLEQMTYLRTQLGDGDVPLAEIVGALEASGYRGFYENENIVSLPRSERVEFVRVGGDRLGRVLAST